MGHLSSQANENDLFSQQVSYLAGIFAKMFPSSIWKFSEIVLKAKQMVRTHFITSAPTLLSPPIFAAFFICFSYMAIHSGKMKISAKEKQIENNFLPHVERVKTSKTENGTNRSK